MTLSKIFKNLFLVIVAGFILTACATSKKSTGMMQGDVYTGTDTVEYLATGVKDRVFFATNKSTLTTASRDTLRKQAAWMRRKAVLSSVLKDMQTKEEQENITWLLAKEEQMQLKII